MIKSLKLFAVCILLSAVAMSCTESGDSVGQTGYIDINVVVPPGSANAVDGTRHGVATPGTADESRITTLTFFVFNDANVLELYKAIAINPNNTSSDPMWDPSKSAMRMLLTLGAKNIYVVANWPLTPTADMGDLSSNTTITALENVVRRHSDMPSGNAPVMSGKLQTTLSGGDQDISVDLARQIARADVYPMISEAMRIMGAQISVEGVRFTDMAGASYLFPRTPPASPGGFALWDQFEFRGSSSGVISATSAPSASLWTTSYIPESLSQPTVMIIKARYNGADSYYSIPLNGHESAQPHRYAIERNHIYEYYVTIQGIGSATASMRTFDKAEPGVANVKFTTQIR